MSTCTFCILDTSQVIFHFYPLTLFICVNTSHMILQHISSFKILATIIALVLFHNIPYFRICELPNFWYLQPLISLCVDKFLHDVHRLCNFTTWQQLLCRSILDCQFSRQIARLFCKIYACYVMSHFNVMFSISLANVSDVMWILWMICNTTYEWYFCVVSKCL